MQELNLGWPGVLRVPIRVLEVLVQTSLDNRRESNKAHLKAYGNKQPMPVFIVGSSASR